MAVKKRASAKKQPTQKLPPAEGPQQSNVSRRSTRVQKQVTQTVRPTQPASPNTLMAAARLLHEDTQRLEERTQEKRVSFEDENPAPAQKRHHQGHAVAAFPSEEEESDDDHVIEALDLPEQFHRLNPVQRNGATTEAKSGQPSSQATRSGSLSESRARKLSDLLVKDILAENANSSKAKRTLDDDDHDIFDIDSSPIKRRKGDLTKYTAYLSEDPTEHLLYTLRDHPQELSIEHISQMFVIIQTKIFGSHEGRTYGFAQKHFSFDLSPAQVAAWPLHELRMKYIPLFMTTRYIADGSQYGWRNFFTTPDTRQHLVSAILGEWFTQRVFKHTAFGFPQNLIDILEEKDREYLHYDAVVRSKERARLIRGWFGNMAAWHQICEATDIAVDDLAEELLQVLHPLLPPTLFDPLEESEIQSKVNTTSSNRRRSSVAAHKTSLRSTIKSDLTELIHTVTALHHSIRCTGINGTIIRICPTPPRNTVFHPTAPNVCINPRSCNATLPPPTSDTKLVIKMTCFPRVEAIVPSGPDMRELEFFESQYRADLVLKAKVATGHPNPSSDSIADFSWDDKEHHWPIVPDILQDEEGRTAGTINPQTRRVNTVKRASYVTIYPTLCPAAVYCEWAPTPSTLSHVGRAVQDEPLIDAVHAARRAHTHALRLRLEDLKLTLWNSYAIYGGLAQWGLLSTAALVALCRYFHIPTHLARGLARVFRTAESLLAKSPGVGAQLAVRVEDLWSSTGSLADAVAMPLGAALFQPVARLLDIGGPYDTGLAGRLGEIREGVASVADGVAFDMAGVEARLMEQLARASAWEVGVKSKVSVYLDSVEDSMVSGGEPLRWEAIEAGVNSVLEEMSSAEESLTLGVDGRLRPLTARGVDDVTVDAPASVDAVTTAAVLGEGPVETETVGRDAGEGQVETGFTSAAERRGTTGWQDELKEKGRDWELQLRKILGRRRQLT